MQLFSRTELKRFTLVESVKLTMEILLLETFPTTEFGDSTKICLKTCTTWKDCEYSIFIGITISD